MSSAGLPLPLVLTLLIGCIALLGFTLYRYRTARPAEPANKRLKPLFLSALGRKKDTLPREFYGLPPRSSVSMAPRPSGVGSRLGLGPVLRWGSSLPSGEERIGGASLPKVKASGLPGLDHSFEDAGAASGAQSATSTSFLQTLILASIVALVGGTVYLAGVGGSSQWRQLVLAVAVSCVPWSAALAVGLQQYRPSARTSSRWTAAAAVLVSVVFGCIASAASSWILIAGSTLPLIAATALVVSSNQLLQRGRSRFTRIRLPLDGRAGPEQPSHHRRKKVSDRLFNREKERSFFSGPALAESAISPIRGSEDCDEVLGTSRRDGETTREYILRAQRERDSWLESPTRSSSIANDLPSFCYTDDDDTGSSPPGTPETARTHLSDSARQTDISHAQTSASSSDVDPSFSRIRKASAQATADQSPDGSVWQDGSAEPSILYARNPFDVSLMAGNESTAHAKTTYLRERNSKTGDLRLTGFDIVPPLPAIPHKYSQYSVGNQSFPQSVTDSGSSPSRSARGWQPSEPYTPTVSGWNKQSTDPLLPHGASSMTFASTGNLLQPNDQDYRVRGASVDELMRITDEALVQAEAGASPEAPKSQGVDVVVMACLTDLWLFWALTLPIQVQSTNSRLGCAMLLCGLVLHSAMLAGCCSLSSKLESFATGLSADQEKPLASRRGGALLAGEGISRIQDMSTQTLISSTDSPVPPRWSQLVKPSPSVHAFGFRPSTSTDGVVDREPSQVDLAKEKKLLARRMSRLSSDVWLENGQARPDSGRLSRILSVMSPHPRLSVLPPTKQSSDIDLDDLGGQATPRASRILEGLMVPATPTMPSPALVRQDRNSQVRLSTQRLAFLDSPAMTSFEHHRQRTQSIESSPGAKSVKAAKVHTAMRGKISNGPTILRVGQDGVAAKAISPTDTTSSAFARGHRRFSGLLQGRVKTGEASRRRTLDFGKLGRMQERQSGPEISDAVTVGVLSGLVPSLLGNKRATWTSTAADVSRGHKADTSASWTLASVDLPPFRPSVDILPGPAHAISTSVDFGFNSGLDFSPPGQQSTPNATRRRARHRSNQSLPSVQGFDLIEEVIDAIDAYGRDKDTPVRQYTKLQTADIRRSLELSPAALRRPSQPPPKSSLAGPDTHDLPPLPANIAELLHASEIVSRHPEAVGQAVTSDDQQTTPKARRVTSHTNMHQPSSSLSTVAERSGETQNSLLQHGAIRPSSRADDIAAEDGDVSVILPADDAEIIDEMELIMAMDSPTTTEYMASDIAITSRPSSVDGSTSWLIRRPSKSSLDVPGAEGFRSIMSKKSSDTMRSTISDRSSTTHAASPDRRSEDGPSRRNSVVQAGSRPQRKSHGPEHVAAMQRHSVALGELPAVPTGIRPLQLLQERSVNLEASPVNAGQVSVKAPSGTVKPRQADTVDKPASASSRPILKKSSAGPAFNASKALPSVPITPKKKRSNPAARAALSNSPRKSITSGMR